MHAPRHAARAESADGRPSPSAAGAPGALTALQNRGGNAAFTRAVQEGSAHPAVAVQRVGTGTEEQAASDRLDDNAEAVLGFATDLLNQATAKLAEPESRTWWFKSADHKQKTYDEIGIKLDTAEHAIYGQLHRSPNARPLLALLDGIQRQHVRYAGLLKRDRKRPVATDIDPQREGAGEQLQQLSDTWSKLTSGTGGLRVTGKPRFGGEEHGELPGFDDQMLSAHARLLSRARGRALVTDLVSGNPSGGTTTVRPYHPDQIEIMGGNTEVGAEAVVENQTGGLATADGPARGSGSTIAMPHNFHDSEGAKPGEPVSPAFLVYGHEMVHAQHNQHGINVRNLDNEETATVSGTETSRRLHARAGLEPTTENDLREEHRLPRREHYT